LANPELIRSILAAWERGEDGLADSAQHVIADDPDVERRCGDGLGIGRGDA
jgi:hypothetical protein